MHERIRYLLIKLVIIKCQFKKLRLDDNYKKWLEVIISGL